jgi:endonuclease/exonuclease/phosphatase family metal-dependent hydrolase
MSDTALKMAEETPLNKPGTEESGKRTKLSYINRFAWLLNLGAVGGLVIAYFAPFVSPANFWFLAFFGLGYPVLVIVNVLFVFYWLVLLRPRFLVSLVAVLAGWTYLQGFVQVNLDAVIPDKSKTRFKVMSYNVKLFDLYNWKKNNETRNRIFDLIKEEAPQIICMQEFYHSEKDNYRNLDTLLKLQNAQYHHTEYTLTLRNRDHWGISTFSAYPIVSKGKITFNTRSNNICIWSDIKINDDTIRVYNMHLQSIHFGYADNKFLEEVSKATPANSTDEMEVSKNILRKLKRAFVKRSQQADKVAQHIKSSPYPVIVCGDFNDTPSSYVYRTLGNGLEDAFVESGNGFGRTYGKFPSFRIDYILNSAKFKTYDFRTIKEDLSDHYPISCYFEMWEDAK